MSLNNRLRATLFHLSASALCGIAVAFIVFGVWYPDLLASVLGGQRIFLIMLGVDVALGPLLTFIVYKEGKKRLTFDLSFIVFFQVSALIYGAHVMSVARPAWYVFGGMYFDLIQANAIDKRYIDQANVQYRSVSWFGPEWVSAHLPDEVDKRNEIVIGAFQGEGDFTQRPDLYVPLDLDAGALKKASLPLARLSPLNPGVSVDRVLQKWPEADAYLPLRTKGGAMVVLMKDGSPWPLAVVDLRPY